jgi:hypothetical protein
MEDGSFIFTCSTELVGLFSMAPWGRIALDVEQMRVAQATKSIQEYPVDLKIVGAHVDGVFLLMHSLEATKISDDLVQEHKFEDGSPMFQIKNEPAHKDPTWPQGDAERSHQLNFAKHEWSGQSCKSWMCQMLSSWLTW